MALLAALCLSGSARASEDPRTPTFLTHRQFIDSCQTDLARTLLTSFTPYRTRPIAVMADTAGDADRSLSHAIAQILSDRGLLVRDSADNAAAAGNWTLRFTAEDPTLTLTRAEQRSFLGKIWVQRAADIGLRISIFDDDEGASVWNHASDTTYTDWIRKSELERLQEPGLSPRAPRTSWEKARVPLIVGGGLLVAGMLVLALN